MFSVGCISFGTQPVSPVVQLVTLKLSDVGSRCSYTNSDFPHKKKKKKSCPTSGEQLIRGYTKFDFTVDEGGKGRLNPSRDKSLYNYRRKKVENGWCVHNSDVQNKCDE